jgi:predicted ATPase/DNA-binding winged helix-turn-helix (wHTH) protein
LVNSSRNQSFRFGPFRFTPRRRLLLALDKEVRIGNRALDILTVLIERAGELVTKEELIAYAWPRSVVEEINLRVHIAALRRALGDGQAGNRYIVNTVGRGYSFVAAVSKGENAPADYRSAVPTHQYTLPAPLVRMVGRAKELEALVGLVQTRRFVTILGAAGMGKSTLALAVAGELAHRFDDGTRFVDLTAISDSSLVANATAAAIELTVPAHNPLPELISFLKDKRALLVLDNCEHVIAAAASTVEKLLEGTSQLHILATSREPMGVAGEWQHHLPPLEVPEEGDAKTADAVRHYSAVELFVERALATAPAFELSDTNATLVGDICRRLDGIPLAIELAAARLNVLGVREVASRLGAQLLQVTNTRRTASRRHQTLRAALDWSFELLLQTERILLQRLAAFQGSFTLDSAVGFAARAGLDRRDVSEAIMSLAEKSLIMTDIAGYNARHRLLHTTRAYALERLLASSEGSVAFRWHAEEVRAILHKADTDRQTMSVPDWTECYRHVMDDVRAALQWAFSEGGDVRLGAALTIAVVPLGCQLALSEEIRDQVQLALRRMAELPERDTVVEARLHWALASMDSNLTMLSFTNAVAEADAAWETAGAPKDQIGPRLSKAIQAIENGAYESARSSAQDLGTVARQTLDPLAMLVANRVMAQAEHFCGSHSAARRIAERVLDHPAKTVPLSYVPVPIDHQVSMRIVLSRTLWLQGFADQANLVVEECIEYASSDSPFALCQALALAACPIAFWRGDDARARRLVAMLLEHAGRYRMGRWREYGEAYQRMSVAPTCEKTATLDSSTAPMTTNPPRGLLHDTLVTISPRALSSGVRVASTIDGASWCSPELLRVQGVRLLEQDREDSLDEAQLALSRSFEIAVEQGALAWQLRTAMSMVALTRDERRGAEARLRLSSVYDEFSEGHGTRDLSQARLLLDSTP